MSDHALLASLVADTGAKLCRVDASASISELTVEQLGEQGALALESIAGLDCAGPKDIGFIVNARYREQLLQTRAGLVIMSEGFLKSGYQGLALVHANPYWVYAKLSCLVDARRYPKPEASIASTAVIEPGASVGEGCTIGHGSIVKAGAVLGAGCQIAEHCLIDAEVELGAESVLSAGVKLLRGSRLGESVFIDSGAVIGSEGFGYAPHRDNDALRWQRIAQLGRVVIGDRVSIGANTTIDRGALQDTVIGDDVIIDNQVQVAHNTVIGNGTAIAGCVGIAGSSTIGQRCSIGGGAGIAGHLQIPDDTVVQGMTLINKSISKPGVYASGTGMQPADQWRKSAVRFTQLESMHRRIKRLESEQSD